MFIHNVIIYSNEIARTIADSTYDDNDDAYSSKHRFPRIRMRASISISKCINVSSHMLKKKLKSHMHAYISSRSLNPSDIY